MGKLPKDNSYRNIAALLERDVESYSSLNDKQAVVVPTDPFSEVEPESCGVDTPTGGVPESITQTATPQYS